MNKTTIFRLFLLVLSPSILLASCNNDTPPIKDEDKVVESVVYDLNSYDLDFLSTQTFDFLQGKMLVTYTDGTTSLMDIKSDMYDPSKVSKEVGKHNLQFSVSFANEFSCKVNVDYMVHDDNAVLDFCKYSRFVPYANELKQTDIDNVILAMEYLNKLNDVSSDDYFYSYYSKVFDSEKAIIDIYKNSKKEELLTIYEGMYQSLYDKDEYLACKTAILSFVNRSYSSSKEIKLFYEDTLRVLQNVDKKDLPLEDYKLITIDGLRNRFIATFTELSHEGEKGSEIFYFTTIGKNFYNDLSFSLEPYLIKISEAKSKQEVDNFNNEAFLGCFNEFKEVFSEEIQTRFVLLTNVFTRIDYNVIQEWKRWCAEKPDERDEYLIVPNAWMWDGKGFVIAPIVGGETGVSVEYLPPDDGRQYNIEPYRMATISERTPETINDATSIIQAQLLYEQLFFEFIQSACEKTLEMHYYYKQAMDISWDSPRLDSTSMAKYWRYIANYCGDTVYQKFAYTGVLKEFYGRQYGYDYSSAYRLCSDFYGPSHPNSIEELLDRLIDLIEILK